MKKAVGMMVLLLSAATALVPVAAARDRDDVYRDDCSYQVNYKAPEHEHNDRVQVRDRRDAHDRRDVRNVRDAHIDDRGR